MAETWVETQVEQESGRWNVYLVVTTPEGVERRLLTSHHTRADAERMASTTTRTARRRRSPRSDPPPSDPPPPTNPPASPAPPGLPDSP